MPLNQLSRFVEISNTLERLEIIDPRIYTSSSALGYFRFFEETKCPEVYQEKIYIIEERHNKDNFIKCFERMLRLHPVDRKLTLRLNTLENFIEVAQTLITVKQL